MGYPTMQLGTHFDGLIACIVNKGKRVNETLQSLVDEAYAAGIDSSLWKNWARRAGKVLGGISTTFYVFERSNQTFHHNNVDHPNGKVIERYVSENIGRFDPQVRYVTTHVTPHIFTDTDHLDLNDHNSREYVCWAASNANLRHYMTANIPLGGGRYVGGLSVHRGVADGVTPLDARHMFEALFPDFRRALQLGFLHSSKLAEAYWDGHLAHGSEATLLLDDSGQIARCCDATDKILINGDGLSGSGRRLKASDPISDERLQGLMTGAVTRYSRAGSIRIARPSGRAAYVVTAYPLVRPIRHLVPAVAAALVTIVDPTAVRRMKTDLWREAFGLTAREQQIAALLVSGHSLESISAVLAISRDTVRIHLRHLMAKSDTTRQTDLVTLLMRFG